MVCKTGIVLVAKECVVGVSEAVSTVLFLLTPFSRAFSTAVSLWGYSRDSLLFLSLNNTPGFVAAVLKSLQPHRLQSCQLYLRLLALEEGSNSMHPWLVSFSLNCLLVPCAYTMFLCFMHVLFLYLISMGTVSSIVTSSVLIAP